MSSSAYRLAPFASRLRGKLGLRPALATLASRSWVISPAVDSVVPSAVFDARDLDKITGVAPDSNTIASQIQRALGGLQHHRATIAYELRDAVLTEGHLFTQRIAIQIDTTPMPLVAPETAYELTEGVLANSAYGIRYFGHWMVDDLPLTLAAMQLGEPVSTLMRPTPHQTGYLAALGLAPRTIASTRFQSIIVLDDVGQNTYKRERYEALRRLVTAQHPTPRRQSKVMLLRGTSGVRRLLQNEDEVALAMQARGFDVLDATKVSLERILEATLDADLVLGVEGSQLANGAMWMKPGGTMVVIQPPHRFNMYFKDRCDCESIRYAFVVGDPCGEGDFSVELPKLHRLLDRLESDADTGAF